LLFSDRFTGARNPARLPTLDAIPSNPLRPLSSPFYHRVGMTPRPPTAPALPALEPIEEERLTPLFNVVLLDDDDHTYDYVIEMLGKIFMMPPEVAFQHAVEVDTSGRTVVMTCEREQAEFGRDQIHSYGADPRMAKSKGSMSAIVEPAGHSR
jgi:ATP-dependent Clp protease adaptor protein ClpS